MLPEFENIQGQAVQLADKYFLATLRHRWDEHRMLVEEYLSLYRKYRLFVTEGKGRSLAFPETRKQLNELLNRQIRPDRAPDLKSDFGDYITEAVLWSAIYQARIKTTQPESALKILESDRFFMRSAKKVKSLYYYVTRLPWFTGNMVRKLFRRPLSEVPCLQRWLPLRNVLQSFMTVSFPRHLVSHTYLPMQERIRKELSLLMEIDMALEKSDSGDHSLAAAKELSHMAAILQKEKSFPFAEHLRRAAENALPELQLALARSGTIEAPSRSFGRVKTKKNMSRLVSEYCKKAADANLRVEGMLDKWQVRVALHAMYGNIEKKCSELRNSLASGLSEKYLTPLQSVIDFIQQNYKIAEDSLSADSCTEVLAATALRIEAELQGELIPACNRVLGDEELILDLQAFIAMTGESAVNLPQRIAVVSEPEKADQEVSMRNLTEVEFRRFVELDALPGLIQLLGKERLSLAAAFEKAAALITETGRIAVYNLETAMVLSGDEGEKEQAGKIAMEGLDRAQSRAREAREILLNLSAEMDNNLHSALTGFEERLFSYINGKALLEARSRMLRAKALRHTEMIVVRVRQYLANMIITIGSLILKLSRKFFAFYRNARLKLGLDEKPPAVAAEISDFLAETGRAIARLPYVYQRLFVLSPLSDEYFFRGRATEMAKIDEAWTNWNAGRYAPAVVVGETGSGITSLVNLYARNHFAGRLIYRYEVAVPVYHVAELCSFLAALFNRVPFKNKEEVIAHFNSLEGRPVVIIEGLHHLFLRTINGFAAIKIFAELISATNKNVFWLATSNLYGWNYLDKTVKLSDFFGYIIEIQSLSDQEIIDVILRRHMASGFNLRFLPGENSGRDRKLARIHNPEEQQEYLRSKYFGALNNFARSNIAISMLLWLRSASDIKGNEISIALPKGLDLSFVKTLSRDKLFVLQSLMLHDGLREEDIPAVLNFSAVQSRLLIIQLFDDGIVVMKNDLYVVNPLLYRQVAGTLKVVNLIH
jgi:hypothetical protein